MNSRLFLIPAILATTAAFGVSGNAVHIGHELKTSVSVIPSAVALDAHARAAALLSGSRITVGGNPPISATRETGGQHPAVLVAQKWSTRGIDPNTFIVAHPARLQLIAASQTEKDRTGDAQGAETLASASTQVTSPRNGIRDAH